MQSVVGVFATPADACRAFERLTAASIARDRVSLLLPGTPEREIARRVPVDEGEQPGMGDTIGGVVGGAVGLTAAAIVLPGVGPIVVAGFLAAGLAGTAGGAAAGDFSRTGSPAGSRATSCPSTWKRSGTGRVSPSPP